MLSKQEIEKLTLEHGIRCNRLRSVGYPNSEVQIYLSDGHYVSQNAPNANLHLRIIVEGEKLSVIVFEEVKTIVINQDGGIIKDCTAE